MPVVQEKIKTTPIFMALEVSVCEPQIMYNELFVSKFNSLCG